jgi:hypothetical protein
LTCFNCGQKGHTVQKCKSSRNQSKVNKHFDEFNKTKQSDKNNKNKDENNYKPFKNNNFKSESKSKTYESANKAKTMESDPEYICLTEILMSAGEKQNLQFNNKCTKIKGSSNDLRNYFLDSGSSSHFTPYLEDLSNTTTCSSKVMLADSSIVHATQQGEIKILFISEQGKQCKLKLLRVLYIPGLNRRLFRIPEFVRDSNLMSHSSET